MARIYLLRYEDTNINIPGEMLRDVGVLANHEGSGYYVDFSESDDEELIMLRKKYPKEMAMLENCVTAKGGFDSDFVVWD